MEAARGSTVRLGLERSCLGLERLLGDEAAPPDRLRVPAGERDREALHVLAGDLPDRGDEVYDRDPDRLLGTRASVAPAGVVRALGLAVADGDACETGRLLAALLLLEGLPLVRHASDDSAD